MSVTEQDNLFICGLTEEERKIIEKIARHLLNHGRLKGNEYFKRKDAIRLQRVIYSYKQYKDPTSGSDVVDGHVVSSKFNQGRRSFRIRSVISPSRFLVDLSEETKYIVRNVNEMLQEWKNSSLAKKDYVPLDEIPKITLAQQQEEIWRQRGKVYWWSLIFAFSAPLTYLIDTGTDLNLALAHFSKGNPWWGILTLILVIFPSMLANLMSYFFYVNDEDKVRRKPESGWAIVKITHVLQLGLIERYWRVIVLRYKLWTRKFSNVTPYKLNIAMNLDTAMLQMILAFSEDAPQLVLQLYIIIRQELVEHLRSPSFQVIKTLLAICFSFMSYSLALVNYHNALRDSKADKGQLRWFGFIAVLLWRAFMIVSRVFALVFFATEFPLWIFAFLVLHFVVVLALIWKQEMEFFGENGNTKKVGRSVISCNNTTSESKCRSSGADTVRGIINDTMINADTNDVNSNSSITIADTGIPGNACVTYTTNTIDVNIIDNSLSCKNGTSDTAEITNSIENIAPNTAQVTTTNNNNNIQVDKNKPLNSTLENHDLNKSTDHNDNDDRDLEKRLQLFTRFVIAYMHTFSFFILEARQMMRWAVKFYLLIAVEAVAISTIWFTNSTNYVSCQLEVAAMAVIFLSFGAGIVVMVVYYKCMYPSFKKTPCTLHTKTCQIDEFAKNGTDIEANKDYTKQEFDLGMHFPISRASCIVRKVMNWV